MTETKKTPCPKESFLLKYFDLPVFVENATIECSMEMFKDVLSSFAETLPLHSLTNDQKAKLYLKIEEALNKVKCVDGLDEPNSSWIFPSPETETAIRKVLNDWQ